MRKSPTGCPVSMAIRGKGKDGMVYD